jgi:hypothetical protein
MCASGDRHTASSTHSTAAGGPGRAVSLPLVVQREAEDAGTIDHQRIGPWVSSHVGAVMLGAVMLETALPLLTAEECVPHS